MQQTETDRRGQSEKKVIFWDFDGTLVYSNRSFLEALQQGLRDLNYVPDGAACSAFLKSACSWNHPEIAYPERTGEAWWRDLLGQLDTFLQSRGIPASDRSAVCRQFRAHAASYVYRPYADAGEILAYAGSLGYESYVLSNNFPELRQTVEALGWGSYFQDILLSSEIGHEKPRPEIFRYAMERAGNPAAAWMVGDNPAADMEGAAALGLHTVQVHPKTRSPEAEAICMELGELRQLLR